MSVNKRAEKMVDKRVSDMERKTGKRVGEEGRQKIREDCLAKIKEKDEKKESRRIAREERRKQKEENPSSARKIFGAVGNAGKIMAKGTGEASKDAIKGMFEYAKDNKRKIAGKVAGATFGMATAGMMLGGADFGDFSKAVAGYRVGSGFAEGYMKNSSKELQSQSEAAAAMIANLTGDGDIQNILATAQQEGANDINKNLNNAINKIRDLLGKHGNKDHIINEFNKIANGKNAGKLTPEVISQMLSDNGIKGEENKAATQAFTDYGKLIGYKSIASNIDQAASMGIDRESLGKIIGDFEVEETVTTTVNLDDIANKVVAKMTGSNASNLSAEDIKRELSGLSESQKNQVVQKINVEVKDVNSIDDVINKLDSQNS